MDIKKRKEIRKKTIIGIILGLLVSILIFFFVKNILISMIGFFISFFLVFVYFYFSKKLKQSARIKKIEGVFPDFLQLMSSNLRAGMTIDRSMLLSSRPEFNPLDNEILKAGKDITTGKSINNALLDMSKRIKSPKIDKTILLILSGINAGGDLSILLEETSTNMREREVLEKKAASSVLMYVIFIFLAVSIFAPALFSLSTILVEILTNIFSGLPDVNTNLPFTLSKIKISITFIKYFAVFFIIVIDVLAAFVLGLVNKGDEKQGIKYILPLLAISLSVFFIARILISNFMSGLF